MTRLDATALKKKKNLQFPDSWTLRLRGWPARISPRVPENPFQLQSLLTAQCVTPLHQGLL